MNSSFGGEITYICDTHICTHTYICILLHMLASLVTQTVKNPPAIQETWVQSLGWQDPLKEGMATHSSILAWSNLHGQKSLVGYSPWGRKESDSTE